MMATVVDGGAEEDDLDIAADAPRQGPNEAMAALALESSGAPSTKGGLPEPAQLTRKEKRKAIKKLRRKQMRQQAAAAEKAEENAALDDSADIHGIQLEEKAEAEALAKEKADHDEQERLWIEREKQAMEDFQRRQEEERKRAEEDGEADSDGQDSFVDGDGPPEIIWKGNEIIVRKRRVPASVVPPVSTNLKNVNKSTSNPLPPQSSAFAAHNKPLQAPDADEHSRTFGTEQDRTHCPFHIKTGVCRFGVRCSRVHVYPDQSFTLLMRNMYTGPGLTWEHDEGLEYSDEEVAQHYEEFFEDVHSEFLQYGELVNFKVCKNGSSHLRGNVYVHYKTEASAQAAYNAMNGRFYAGKQITCEFVGVTKWRVALCGEFMKGHHRPCSRGTACNFLHCFRNPNGEYDWADWECSRPRYWAAKMAKLFGYDSSLKGGNDESDEDSRRNNGSPRSPRQREGCGHNESRNKNRHRRSIQNDYDGTDRHRAHRRHDRHGHRNRSDSDDDPGTSSKHRVHRGQQRQVTRYRSDSDDTSERASRHKGESRHRIRGDRYHVDPDDANDRSSRHRPRGSLEIQDNCNGSHSDDSLVGWPRHRHKDSHHSSSLQDMDERGKDSWKDLDKHSNERQGSKRRKLGRGDRRPSSDSRYTSSNVQDSKHTTERHSRAVGDGQSTGLNQRRHKHRSIPSGKECQSGSHTNDTGREDEFDGKIRAKNSHKIGRGGSAMRGGKDEDDVSSDSDVTRTHELHRGHHDKYREGKRKRRKEEPRKQTCTTKGEENTLLDPDDRWRGTSVS